VNGNWAGAIRPQKIGQGERGLENRVGSAVSQIDARTRARMWSGRYYDGKFQGVAISGRTGATRTSSWPSARGTRQARALGPATKKTGSGNRTLSTVIITISALSCSPEQISNSTSIELKKKKASSSRATGGGGGGGVGGGGGGGGDGERGCRMTGGVVAIESDRRELRSGVLQRGMREIEAARRHVRKAGRAGMVGGYKAAGGHGSGWRRAC